MGVIYKLKAEIKDFILEQKRANPILSCRGLIVLVENKFQIKVSKSSVNSIIKEAGLSMPIGRSQKKRRRRQGIPIKLIEFKSEAPPEIKAEVLAKALVEQPVAVPVETQVDIHLETSSEMQCTGAILLKAADYLIKGSYYFTEAIKNQLNRQENDLLTKTESLIYLPLFELPNEAQDKDILGLWALIDKKLSLENILLYLNDLQSVRTIAPAILRIISDVLQEVHCIKVDYLDGNTLYIDGQIYTIWSTPQIPYDFSSTIYNIKSYINKYFYKNEPFILFMAPGYDTPTKEFFNFILNLDSKEKKIASLTLYDNKLEKLEIIPLEQAKRRFFVFGLWPWQFGHYRKVKKIEEFKPGYFEALKKDFYVAEIEIELSQPITNQSVTLRGCALKTSPAENMRLTILSNFPSEAVKAEELANIYLSHWPNLEECFQDFSRKIELFTYTATSQRFFVTDNLNLNKEPNLDIKALFYYYLKALDFYVMWHFLPFGYEDKDFSTIKEHFYSLKAGLKKQKDYILVTFKPPLGYPFLKDLEYACRRVNEREIFFADGKRLWFSAT